MWIRDEPPCIPLASETPSIGSLGKEGAESACSETRASRLKCVVGGSEVEIALEAWPATGAPAPATRRSSSTISTSGEGVGAICIIVRCKRIREKWSIRTLVYLACSSAKARTGYHVDYRRVVRKYSYSNTSFIP